MSCGIEQINHTETAISRLADQYSESTNFLEYVSANMTQIDILENVLQDVLCMRSIDNGSDYTLDIVGKLVGQKRSVISANFLWFGFQGNAQSGSFGELGNPSVGARFRSLNEPTASTRILTDEEYKIFIKARTFRNTTDCTINSILNHLSTLFETSVHYENLPNILGYKITFGRNLSANEKIIITDTNILPEPAGTEVQYFDQSGQIN